MSTLPVFSTIGSAMGIFGLHLGKLSLWTLFPLLVSGLSLGAALGLHAWKGLWLGWVPGVILAIMAWVPYAMRVNQLTVLGRVQDDGYARAVFGSRSLRYLGYGVLMHLIQGVGMGLAAIPAIIVYARQGDEPTVLLGVATLASLVLVLALLVLTAPLNLIYPAASVEANPSLGRAAHLGWPVKARLFMAMAFSSLLFTVLALAVDAVGRAFGAQDNPLVQLALLPVQATMTLFSYVVSVAVPAEAYRVLSGLPKPQPDGGCEPEPALLTPAGGAGVPGTVASGTGDAGPGTPGAGTPDPGAYGPGVPDPDTSGPGTPGPGTSGPTSSGADASAPGDGQPPKTPVEGA